MSDRSDNHGEASRKVKSRPDRKGLSQEQVAQFLRSKGAPVTGQNMQRAAESMQTMGGAGKKGSVMDILPPDDGVPSPTDAKPAKKGGDEFGSDDIGVPPVKPAAGSSFRREPVAQGAGGTAPYASNQPQTAVMLPGYQYKGPASADEGEEFDPLAAAATGAAAAGGYAVANRLGRRGQQTGAAQSGAGTQPRRPVTPTPAASAAPVPSPQQAIAAILGQGQNIGPAVYPPMGGTGPVSDVGVNPGPSPDMMPPMPAEAPMQGPPRGVPPEILEAILGQSAGGAAPERMLPPAAARYMSELMSQSADRYRGPVEMPEIPDFLRRGVSAGVRGAF